MKDDQIKYMVDRFLQWKLPEDFNPDCGIRFDADAAKKMNPRNHRYEPVGTNLLTATQADKMVRFMIDGVPDEPTLGDMLHLATGDFEKLKDYAWRAAAMLRFLLAHEGECIGDHPDWVKRINAMLSEQPG